MHKNTHTDLSDETLLMQYSNSNDNYWFGILLQRYTLLLLGVAMKYLKDQDQAADAVQQVFLKALTNLPKEEIHNFKGWLYVLTRNYCLQQLRDRKHIAEINGNEPVYEPSDTNETINEVSPEQISEALEQLNREQKECIVLFYLNKLSYEQIMEKTGYSYMQVKSYIQNGKRNLKQLLLKQNNK